jgi:hypothetical protein
MSQLSTTVHDRLDAVSPEQWQSLFPNHPDSLEIIRLIQDCGMDNFSFAAILVRRGEEPILLLPLFRVPFRLAGLLDGATGKIVRAVEHITPGLVTPRLLGVGFVEGEWGQIGVKKDLDQSTLTAAWTAAETALREESRRGRAALTVFLNFTPQAAAGLPANLTSIDTIPCAQLPIDFASPDEYLHKLSKNMRKDLRRKLKSAADVGIVRSMDAPDWIERIYALYLRTVARAPLSLGIQRQSFFQRVGKEVPGAHYVLYTRDNQLLAFNLLVERDGMLIDKYFCMDEQRGREHSLYFVSWMENIAHCCRAGLKTYHAGPGAEATKSRLGAKFIPSKTLFRHRNPLAHALLTRLKPLIAYKPAIEIAGETNETI